MTTCVPHSILARPFPLPLSFSTRKPSRLHVQADFSYLHVRRCCATSRCDDQTNGSHRCETSNSKPIKLLMESAAQLARSAERRVSSTLRD